METIFSERKKVGTATFAQVRETDGEVVVHRWEQDVIPVVTAKFDDDDGILLIECLSGLEGIEPLEILKRCHLKGQALRLAICSFDAFCLQVQKKIPIDERSDDEILVDWNHGNPF